MKLRNKKTGEIGKVFLTDNGIEVAIREAMWSKVYNSLDELNAEWKDYEEPKYDDEWLISCGRDYIEPVYAGFSEEILKRVDEIGLLIKTKEEAEKAVEKLKAWTRLRDKGFKFRSWFWIAGCGTFIRFEFIDDDDSQNGKDLDLLFGGEE